MGSFFHSIGKFFHKIFGSAPTYAQQASAALKYIGPVAATLVQLLIGPEAGAEAQQVVAEVQVDLALLYKLLNDAHSGATDKAAITAAVKSLQDNLNELLTAGHIKDAALLEKIKVPANLILGELQAILGGLK